MVLFVVRDYSAGLTSQVISATNLPPDGLRAARNAGLVDSSSAAGRTAGWRDTARKERVCEGPD